MTNKRRRGDVGAGVDVDADGRIEAKGNTAGGRKTSAAFDLVVMAKAPIAGLAKTRLVPLLGPAGAARAQRGFALRTLATAQAARPGSLTLSCAPDQHQRFFQALRRSVRWKGLRFTNQAQGDIGQRMAAVFAEHGAYAALQLLADRPSQRPTAFALEHGQPAGSPAQRARPSPQRVAPKPLLLIGTDCPVLTSGYLHAAANTLQQGADVVFGPVEDGGYMLIGLREPSAAAHLGLFECIDWSTERVMTQSRARLRAVQASWHELPLLWDVDEPADWLRWQQMQEAAR